MGGTTLLIALLALSYVGSLWSGTRSRDRVGTLSGVEFFVLGFVLGPRMLGVVGESAVLAFEPVVHIALGWLGLVVGLGARARVVAAPGALVRTLTWIWPFLPVALAAFVLAWALPQAGAAWLVPLALPVAACLVDSSHHAAFALPAGTESVDVLRLLARPTEALVLLAIALAAAYSRGPLVVYGLSVTPPLLALATLVIGGLLGALAAALLKPTSKSGERWGVLLGATFIATGASTSVGLEALSATCALGLVLSFASRHGDALREATDRTRPAVLFPTFLLAGAQLELPRSGFELSVIVGAVLAKLLLGLVGAWLVLRVLGEHGRVLRAVFAALYGVDGVGLLLAVALSLHGDGAHASTGMWTAVIAVLARLLVTRGALTGDEPEPATATAESEGAPG